MSSPIELREFFLERLNIEFMEGENQSPEKVFSLSLSFNVATSKENENLFKLTLGVQIKPDEQASMIQIDSKIVGFFSIDPAINEPKKRQFYMFVNGSTVLYGILRGQISMITASFPSGKFNLPAVVMQEEVENFFAKQQKHAKKAKVLPAKRCKAKRE